MAKYQVYGFDRKTGSETKRLVDAASKAEATARVADELIVGKVDEVTTTAPSTEDGRHLASAASFLCLVGFFFAPCLLFAVVISAMSMDASKGQRGRMAFHASRVLFLLWIVAVVFWFYGPRF